MLEVKVITTTIEMEDLRPCWEDLMKRASNASIFQTWEWISSCWQHFGKQGQLVLVCVWEDGRLVGLAPFEISSLYRLPVRRLKFIGYGVSDYLDIIVDDESQDRVLNGIYDWIAANQRRWDLIDLQFIPEGSPTLRSELISNVGRHNSLAEQDVSHYTILPPLWEDMLADLGKKTRQNLNYYERKLHRDFDNVSLCEYEGADFDEWVEALFRLHSACWQIRGCPGIVADSRMEAFYRDALQLFRKRGWIRLQGVRLNGQLQAVDCSFAYKGKVYYYMGGFEPQFSKYSLGTLLTSFVVRRAIEEGFHEFDFLRGNESYKDHWTAKRRLSYRLAAGKFSLRSLSGIVVTRIERKAGFRTKCLIKKCLRW